MRVKPPFGIAQIGKSFRNEITPGQLPLPHARVRADGDGVLRPARRGRAAGTRYWIDERRALVPRARAAREPPARARRTTPTSSRTTRAATSDLEYLFPIGWSELEGIANRGDFDLRAHAAGSNTKLEWVGHEERYVPHVIEPAAGADRAALAFLVDAYDEEVVAERPRTRAAPPPAARARQGGGAAARRQRRARSSRRRARSTRSCAGRSPASTTTRRRSASATAARTRSAPPGRSRSTARRSPTTRSPCATATRSPRSGSRSAAARELLLDRLEQPWRPALAWRPGERRPHWRDARPLARARARERGAARQPARRPGAAAALRLDAARPTTPSRRGASRPLYVLHGMTGQARAFFNVSPFTANLPSCSSGPRPRRSSSSSTASPRSAARSGSTRPAIGAYGTYLCEDVVGFVDAGFRTLADAAHRGLAGTSSGGFGARGLGDACGPTSSAGFASHAGDCLFEVTLAAEFAPAAQRLRNLYGGSFERFWEDFRSGRPVLDNATDPLLQNLYATAAAFSPRRRRRRSSSPSRSRPASSSPRSGERWLAWDPVRLARRAAPRRCAGLRGDLDRRRHARRVPPRPRRDRARARRSRAAGAAESVVHFELFAGGHRGLGRRLPSPRLPRRAARPGRLTATLAPGSRRSGARGRRRSGSAMGRSADAGLCALVGCTLGGFAARALGRLGAVARLDPLRRRSAASPASGSACACPAAAAAGPGAGATP